MKLNSINILIYLCLSKLIHIPEICKYIISIKDNEEYIDTLNYHIKQYNKSGFLYYNSIKNIPGKRTSYILDGNKFIIHIDHCLNFYLSTKISYQVIDIIHRLIKEPCIDVRNYDDKLYKKLCQKIKDKMDFHLQLPPNYY